MPVVSLGFDTRNIRGGVSEAIRHFDAVSRSVDSADKKSKSLASTLKSVAGTVLAAVGAYRAVSDIAFFVQGGIQYNKQLENAKLGIAAIMATTQELETVQGRLLQGAEKFAAAQQLSEKMAKALDVASMKSSAQYQDLLASFQTTLAPAAKLGLTWQNTLDTTILMSNVLSSMNIPMDRLARETNALMTGMGLSRSAVGLRLGITKAEIDSWGTGEQYMENFLKKFEQMRYAGDAVASTFEAVTVYYNDSLKALSAMIGSGIFEQIKASMLTVADSIFYIDDVAKEFHIQESFQPLVTLLQDIATWSAEGFTNQVKGMMSGLQDVSAFIKDNRDTLDSMAESFPIVIAAIGGWVIATKLGGASVAQFTASLITHNKVTADAAVLAAASAKNEHARAAAALEAALAERERVVVSATALRVDQDRLASDRALVAAEAQVSAAQVRVTETATTMAVAQQRAAVASTNLSTAAATGFARLKNAASGLMGMLGGPWGIAIMAATIGVYAFAAADSEAEKVAKSYGRTLEEIEDHYKKLADGAANAAGATKKLTESHRQAIEALARQNIEGMEKEIASVMEQLRRVSVASVEFDPFKNVDRSYVDEFNSLLEQATLPGANFEEIGTRLLTLKKSLENDAKEMEGFFNNVRRETLRFADVVDLAFHRVDKARVLTDKLAESNKNLDETTRVVGHSMQRLFSDVQMKGLSDAIDEVQFKLDQLGRTAADQMFFEAVRKTGVDLSKVSVGAQGSVFIEQGTAEEREQLQLLRDKISELSSAQGGAKKSAGDYASAIKQVNDALAKMEKSEAEYARYEFGKKYADWLKDLGKVTPELQRLAELENLALDAGYDGSDSMVDHIRDVGQAIEEMGLTEAEKRIKAVNDEFDRLFAAMDKAGGQSLTLGGVTVTREQAEALQARRLRETKSGSNDAQILVDFEKEYLTVMRGAEAAQIASIRERAAAYEQAGTDVLRVAEWVSEMELQYSRTATDGMKRGMKSYADEAMNAGKHLESFMTNAFQGIEDAMVQAFKAGKISFSDMADSMLADMIRLTVRQSVTGPLASALSAGIGSLFNSGAGSFNSNPGIGVDAASTSVYRWHGSAQGNAFAAGTTLSDFRNAIIDRPTFFEFAQGGIGLMGEKAGSPGEAIMPLTRNSRGDLAVSAVGSATPVVSAPQISVIINNNAPVDIETRQSTGPDGNINLELFIDPIDQMLAKRQAQGKSAFGKTIATMNGLNFTPQLYRN
jgi:lambda family phage tail tape measure protein